ncbi:MAG: VanZ family protein [Candidatus Eiseniibacteriota bacterium]
MFLRYWVPVFAYVTLIFALSSIANLRPPIRTNYADKLAHLVEYAILGTLLARAFRGSRAFPSAIACSLLAVITGFATGIADELFQEHVPGRISSALDFVFDSVGVVLGQLLYALLARHDD